MSMHIYGCMGFNIYIYIYINSFLKMCRYAINLIQVWRLIMLTIPDSYHNIYACNKRKDLHFHSISYISSYTHLHGTDSIVNGSNIMTYRKMAFCILMDTDVPNSPAIEKNVVFSDDIMIWKYYSVSHTQSVSHLLLKPIRKSSNHCDEFISPN